MDLTPQITALQSQVDALGRQVEEKEQEGEVLVVRSSFFSFTFCVEIFSRKTQIEGKAANLVEAKSHCLYYENYEASQRAKCRDLDEAAREIAASLEVSGHLLKDSAFSDL